MMDFRTSRRALALVTMWTVGGRLFNAALLDARATESASWISILVALLLTTPTLLVMTLMTRHRREASPASLLDAGCGAFARRALSLVLCAFAMVESAYQTRVLVMGAQYIAFDLVPAYQLALITVLVGCLACLCGGSGVTGAGKMLLLPYLLAVAVLGAAQIGRFNPRWLMPIFGYGAQVILRQALVFAGYFTFMIAAWLCLGEETGKDSSGGQDYKPTSAFLMPQTALLAAMLAAIVSAAVAMLIPTMPSAPNERIVALNMLLANGRIKVAYQLPMILIWFGHSICSFVAYLFVSAALLGGAIPKLKPALCVLIVSAGVFALTISDAASRNISDALNQARYLLLTPAFVAMGVAYLIRERVKRNVPKSAA